MSSAENADQAETPQPQLGLWDAISIITGIVIGTSIFKIPWLIFMNVSDPWMGLLVWVFGGFLAFVGGLCYAELATTYPRSGGDYVYLTKAFGPWAGFLFGWAQLSIVLTASIGAMAFVFAENATLLYDLSGVVNVGVSSEFLYAVLAIVVISVLNAIGVTMGKIAQNILTVLKVAGLGAIMIAGLFWVESSPAEWQFAESSSLGWGSLALILVLYAYGGWNDAAFVAAEVRNVKRNIPLSLLLGIGLITLIYILVNAAYLVGLGFEQARQPGAQLPQLLLEWLLPGFGGKAITVIIMTSALGAVNGLTFTGARVYATLGNDYWLFGWLGHWKPGKRAPVLSLIVQALITISMLATLCTEAGHRLVNDALKMVNIQTDSQWQPGGGFEALVSHSAPVFWVFFLMTGLSLMILRVKDRGIERPFTSPLFPIMPLIFCAMCAYMLYQSSIYVGWRALFAVALVATGIPLFILSLLIGGYKEDTTDSQK
jgi:APA family basic amino acid/polyamine antiporter